MNILRKTLKNAFWKNSKGIWTKNIANAFDGEELRFVWNFNQIDRLVEICIIYMKLHIILTWRKKHLDSWKKSSEHFLRIVLWRWLRIQVWRVWWVRWSQWGGWCIVNICIIYRCTHIIFCRNYFCSFLRKAVCVRDKEGWVQMSAVARYLLPL